MEFLLLGTRTVTLEMNWRGHVSAYGAFIYIICICTHTLYIYICTQFIYTSHLLYMCYCV